METDKISRRNFLGKTTAATIAITVVPSMVLGSRVGKVAPSDMLNIAAVGIGGVGKTNLNAVNRTEIIVALCDTNWEYAKSVFNAYPNAKKFYDWRVMLNEINKSIDAVIVATPNHSHCVIAANAIAMGKHVYVQAPLAHTVYEARLLAELAAKYKVVTQMGNQGSSGNGVRQICEWIWNGEIGEILKIEAFADTTEQYLFKNEALQLYSETENINWDIFSSPSQLRSYSNYCQPFNWRRSFDFSSGKIANMGCHILHPVFKAMKLGYPTRVQGSSTPILDHYMPDAEIIKFTFPEREADKNSKIKFPELEVTWFDGGILPMKPKDWPVGSSLSNSGGGVVFHGTRDTLICGGYGKSPWLLSGRKPVVNETLRRIGTSHEMDWVQACKENESSRRVLSSPFAEAAVLSEMISIGSMAVRLQSLNRELDWNAKAMTFTNIADTDNIELPVKQNFISKNNADILIENTRGNVSAKEYLQQLIKPTYRKGYNLPEMNV